MDSVQWPEVMQRLLAKAERFKTEIVFDHINAVDFSRRPFTLKGDSGEYTCDALLLATGASAKYLGLPPESAFLGHGPPGFATPHRISVRKRPGCCIGGRSRADAAPSEAL